MINPKESKPSSRIRATEAVSQFCCAPSNAEDVRREFDLLDKQAQVFQATIDALAERLDVLEADNQLFREALLAHKLIKEKRQPSRERCDHHWMIQTMHIMRGGKGRRCSKCDLFEPDAVRFHQPIVKECEHRVLGGWVNMQDVRETYEIKDCPECPLCKKSAAPLKEKAVTENGKLAEKLKSEWSESLNLWKPNLNHKAFEDLSEVAIAEVCRVIDKYVADRPSEWLRDIKSTATELKHDLRKELL